MDNSTYTRLSKINNFLQREVPIQIPLDMPRTPRTPNKYALCSLNARCNIHAVYQATTFLYHQERNPRFSSLRLILPSPHRLFASTDLTGTRPTPLILLQYITQARGMVMSGNSLPTTSKALALIISIRGGCSTGTRGARRS
jgi:hypothetical protein